LPLAQHRDRGWGGHDIIRVVNQRGYHEIVARLSRGEADHMKKRIGVAIPMAVVALMVLACSKPESSQRAAASSTSEPQAVSQVPQAAADTPQAAAQPATGRPEGAPAVAVSASEKVYVCDMGCEVADHPGKCSKCGMTLKEVNPADIGYVCEVCGFKSDKPGACPKDHTILVLKIQEHKG